MADRKMIYLDDAINAFDCSIGGVPVDSVKYVSEYSDKMMSRISALPSTQPIVFCKDCEYGEKLPDTIRCEYNDYLPFNYNDFCSHGVKRINGGKDE